MYYSSFYSQKIKRISMIDEGRCIYVQDELVGGGVRVDELIARARNKPVDFVP